MISLNKVEKYYCNILILLFLIGLVGYAVPLTKEIIHQTTEPFLYFTGLLTLAFSVYRNLHKKKYILIILLIFLTTMALEITGVATGKIFGSYYYGELFHLKIASVPIIIGINWTIVILGAYSISNNLMKGSAFLLILMPVFILLFDFLLEPIAMNLDYWQWADNIVPLRNYVVWVITSVLISVVLYSSGYKVRTPLIERLWIIQMIFFFGLHIVLKIPFF